MQSDFLEDSSLHFHQRRHRPCKRIFVDTCWKSRELICRPEGIGPLTYRLVGMARRAKVTPLPFKWDESSEMSSFTASDRSRTGRDGRILAMCRQCGATATSVSRPATLAGKEMITAIG